MNIRSRNLPGPLEDGWVVRRSHPNSRLEPEVARLEPEGLGPARNIGNNHPRADVKSPLHVETDARSPPPERSIFK
eukprot:3913163-Pyramimonas_sp.AAC.2